MTLINLPPPPHTDTNTDTYTGDAIRHAVSLSHTHTYIHNTHTTYTIHTHTHTHTYTGDAIRDAVYGASKSEQHSDDMQITLLSGAGRPRGLVCPRLSGVVTTLY